MNSVVMTVVSALSQVVLFSLIPFIVWLIWQRKKVSFPEYVGLKKPKRTASWWIIIPLFAVYFVIYFFADRLYSGDAVQIIQSSPDAAVSQFAGLGAAAIFPAFVSTFVQNGFCEELLFRGFLCKRLIKWLGEPAGIIIQAAVFALIHNIMFIKIVPDLGFHLLIFGLITAQTMLLAIFNEKFFNGSIWLSILLHGLGNFYTTMLAAFAK